MSEPQIDYAGSLEIKAALDELGRGFDEFKSANDAARGDVVDDEKVARISAGLTRIEKKLNDLHLAARRPGFGGSAAPEVSEHKQAFLDRFIRKGLESGLSALESKSLLLTPNVDGGYAVPVEIDQKIEALLRQSSPVRAVANVVQTGSANYKKLATITGAVSGWVGESAARPLTDTPDFAEIVPTYGEIYANPAATQTMLDDAMFDVESWLANEVAVEFAQKEGAAFIAGDGTSKPKGFLTYTTAATSDASRAFGTLQHMITGVSAGFAASNASDILFDLVHSLKAGYRGDAVFLMNSNTLARIRKFKDVDGNYLWRPGLAEGTQPTLLGYPVYEAEDMPDIAASSLSIVFGNFNRGYVITDRMGTRVLRDPYSNKPYVHFYTTRRVGGAVVNSEAIKILRFSAT